MSEEVANTPTDETREAQPARRSSAGYVRRCASGVVFSLRWCIGAVGASLAAIGLSLATAAVVVAIGAFCAVAVVGGSVCIVLAIVGCMVGGAIGIPGLGLMPHGVVSDIGRHIAKAVKEST